MIAKPCEHLAGTRYSHQTLQEILEYFRLCKWRAAEEAQTALGTAQLFHGPHLVATDTCTPVTPPELWRGNDVRMKFKTRITSTIRNLAAGKRSQTPLAVKHTHSRRKEVCWPKVTRWPLPFSAACAIFACVVPNLTKLKLLQVQIDFYRCIEPPLTRCKKKKIIQWFFSLGSERSEFRFLLHRYYLSVIFGRSWFCLSILHVAKESVWDVQHPSKHQEDNNLKTQNGAKPEFTTKHDKGPQKSECELIERWKYLPFL